MDKKNHFDGFVSLILLNLKIILVVIYFYNIHLKFPHYVRRFLVFCFKSMQIRLKLINKLTMHHIYFILSSHLKYNFNAIFPFNFRFQFWGAEKDTSRLESAIFEDLNRYCWSQQSNSGSNTNQSINTDGQVSRIYFYRNKLTR